jgi:hypothetical protein
MISCAAMLGTFCLTFFGLTALTNPNDAIGIALFGCIMSVFALIAVNSLMTNLKSN